MILNKLGVFLIKYGISFIAIIGMIYVGQQEQPFGLNVIQMNQLLSVLLMIVLVNMISVVGYEYLSGTYKEASPKAEIFGGLTFLLLLLFLFTYMKIDQESITTVLLFASPIVMIVKGLIRLIISKKSAQRTNELK
ncbi:hypothetical protein [Alkalicoccobacillus murimartini]|uniref:Prolipoprotein diacylglyceryltransferase n=1 Tax=Alkalicoccobacillus murimartini TaxID=171685 RepID=A0ABT9YJ78_9BACI|nr:hypothetical protein [Alkalicoccobacillus murimartini]MDQ0207918.1 prolipoprotein diacylglyceryltransferase [Alkalicoccobacillus murimartini]